MKFCTLKFQWQEARLNDVVGQGYGAFSYSHSQLDRVINYIKNQKGHHKKQSFKDEYLQLLRSFQIEFKEE